MGFFTALRKHHLRFLLAAVALIASPPAGMHQHTAFHQDAYIWQRAWTPAVTSALQQSRRFVDGWHVLVAETGADGRLQVMHPDWAQLMAGAQTLTPVIRIDGALIVWDPTQTIRDIEMVLHDLHGRGVPISGVEIDYDCATSKLSDYSRFLAELHRGLGSTRLSITALPAWLASPDLNRVLDEADEVVLQVHAVRDPHGGLFDPQLARAWTEDLSARTDRPFVVALPTYGTRVAWGEDGRIVAVESEMLRFTQGATSRELFASPREVAELLASLKRDPPSHLAGVVWFRLPTDDDSRAWSLNTWWAVMRGKLRPEAISLVTRPGDAPGLEHLVLINEGETDAILPAYIPLPSGCDLADGANGYSLDYSDPNLKLHRSQPGLLHGRRELMVGWMRCSDEKVAMNVQQ